ncbi:PadR family transcriptional regulator [Pararhodospirillum photometricum]|uniref:Transcriptional regulator, PadR family n=1 Tax=Pararhodospirillum photometricum DSM 122 TaxID=1150469 RepID=H6SJ97_PARPM|nr:PadR family transcriptional regulator [Pararhodospirillum photometricum]CCG08062.1 Transcriptional regulator, PadR family [Pararhodospirillum photometricum DSM 122]
MSFFTWPQRCLTRRHARGLFGLGGGLGPGGGHGRGRGGRLGRLFAHGDLHLVILSLIAEKPRHGYEIIKAIEERVAGAYSPSPGTVYPALTLLEDQGYVAQEPAPGSKKLYAITAEGHAYLAQNQDALVVLLSRMDQAQREHQHAISPQILRAMESLKMALRFKGEQAPLSDAELARIVEALDEATRKIEQG